MALHKLLVDDFEDLNYSLLAVHCEMEDFRLAYFLNQILGTRLSRTKEDLDFLTSLATFSVFEWSNSLLKTDWHLIKNNCLVEKVAVCKGLFLETNDKSWVKYSLIPEHNSVDYLLKIDNAGRVINEKEILNKIQKISKVSTAYSIDVSQLKSKEHLIFN
jgi:hypothetical protein